MRLSQSEMHLASVTASNLRFPEMQLEQPLWLVHFEQFKLASHGKQ